MTFSFRPAMLALTMAGLFMLVLIGCGEPDDPPAADTEQAITEQVAGAVDTLQSDAAYYDELRARWLQLEHAVDAEPEPEGRPAVPLPEIVEVQPATAPASAPDATPVIGIIIDDVGHSLIRGRRLIALPAPVALAILPHTQSAQRLASEAGAAGKTVMLHQPMENGAALPIGQGGLYAEMDRAELEATLQANLNSFIPIQGLNNHMGSRLTGEREAMDWVMQVLGARGLFFIDSRTSPATQAAFAAEAHGVRHLSRDVFLDNERTAAAIDAAFQRALKLARKQGAALIIGHPYPETLDYLEQRLPGLKQDEGVVVVSVEELLARKYR
ncbi:divergent polysaccharide deacetylase family protein [Pseudomonas sp. FME51]|uniref:divergent polysaccharide deacetylase family protein n=1 Tax=Pseudomonas sp. FME51 TaxID=2742609 RepID=UPI001D023172|nr:divergent polysaccharide deacetylase family protein [Pseudomonas sp. FME51]